LDLQEQERKRLQQGRKGRVVTAGYDSDEDSDEGEEEEADDGEQNGKVAGVDEDDDMFTLEEGGDAEAKTQKNGKKFLELGNIEGQEFAHKDAEEEERDAELELETDNEEYEVDEEEKEALHDADDVVQPLKKKKKSRPKPGDKDDMGFEIDDFNMKNEMASGRFDEEGNYIANAKDPHAEHDKWLTGHYSRKGIKEAKEAKERREKERKAREKNQDNARLDEDECFMKLAELMEKGETVLEALQRLGAVVKKAGRKNAKTAVSDKDGMTPEMERAKKELEQITSLSSALMSRFGKINAYDETYESILRVVRRSGLVRETWDPAAARDKQGNGHIEEDTRQFTYKWSPAYLAATTQSVEPDVQIFGPYPAQDIKVWFENGYFGDQGERILLRQISNEEGTSQGWKRWEQVFDAL
jgi:CD2 antigen cytoplasmic tail-binding protein 2